MKCNQCGSENADNSAFCSKCGTPLQPSVTVTTPIGQNGSVISGALTSAGPTAQISAPIKNSKVAILIVVVAFVVLLGAGALVWLLVGSKAGETISCTKEGKALTSSVAATFKRNKLSKIEYTMLLEDSGTNSRQPSSSSSSSTSSWDWDPSDPEGSFFSASDDSWSSFGSSSSSSSNLSQSETSDILALSLMFASFEKYSSEPGVEYYENERDALSTYSITVDINKLNSKTKDALFDTEELEASPELFQKTYTSQGYTCSKK